MTRTVDLVLSDPILLISGLVAAALLVGLLILSLRRRPSEPEDDPEARESLHRSIQKTLRFYRKEYPDFVEVADRLFEDVPLDELLDNEEIEIALGKLSYLGEKSRKAQRRNTSPLATIDDQPEARAAMVTFVRACYLCEAFTDRISPATRQQIDEFLEVVAQ